MVTANLSFGEYMRRLRRSKKMSLTQLADKTKLSYTNLSRIENDSTFPNAKTVSRLAEALEGDLKVMLGLADCLPKTILERIMDRQEGSTSLPLNRSAGPGTGSKEAGRPPAGEVAAHMAKLYGLDENESQLIGEVLEDLLRLPRHQLTAVRGLIQTISGGEDDDES